MKRFATLARIGTASVAAVALGGAVTGCTSHELLSVGPQPYVRPVARTAPPAATNLAPSPAPSPAPTPSKITTLPIPAEMRPADVPAAAVQPPPTENIVVVQEVPPAPIPTENVKPLPPLPTPPAVSPPPTPPTPAPALTHTVKKGDTLWEIGRMYGVTMQEIAAANNRDVNGIIKPGEVLKLPAGAAFVPEDQRPVIKKPEPRRPAPPAAGTVRDPATVKPAAKKEIPADGKYVVQKGDTLSEIASMYNLSVAQIKQMNASIKGDTIFPEQTLILRSGVTATAPKTTVTATATATTTAEGATGNVEKTVKVEPVPTTTATTEVEFDDLEMLPYWCNEGDTLASIAKLLTSRVEWIKKANPTIKSDEDLKPRLKIMVPVPKDK